MNYFTVSVKCRVTRLQDLTDRKIVKSCRNSVSWNCNLYHKFWKILSLVFIIMVL